MPELPPVISAARSRRENSSSSTRMPMILFSVECGGSGLFSVACLAAVRVIPGRVTGGPLRQRPELAHCLIAVVRCVNRGACDEYVGTGLGASLDRLGRDAAVHLQPDLTAVPFDRLAGA